MLAGVPTEHVGVSAIVSSAPQHSTTGALPKLTVRPADKGDTRIGSGSLIARRAGKGSVQLRGRNPLATVIKRLIVKLLFNSVQLTGRRKRRNG